MTTIRRIAFAILIGVTAGSPSGRAVAQQFKVAIWYDRANAVVTFQHQVYDLRKGEYREDQVRRWAEATRTGFPRYVVLIQDVTVPPGSSPQAEKQAVTDAVSRVLRPYLRAETAYYSAIGRPSPMTLPSTPGVRMSPSRGGPTPSIGGNSSYRTIVPGVYPGRIR